jgi:hypothetical protein
LDFSEPLSKIQVLNAITENLPQTHTIRRLSFRKGGDSGVYGYYFAEFDPAGYALIPNDTRLYPWFEFNLRDKISFVDYYKRFRADTHPVVNVPRFNKTFKLQFESFKNFIFGKKNSNQLFYERIEPKI